MLGGQIIDTSEFREKIYNNGTDPVLRFPNISTLSGENDVDRMELVEPIQLTLLLSFFSLVMRTLLDEDKCRR